VEGETFLFSIKRKGKTTNCKRWVKKRGFSFSRSEEKVVGAGANKEKLKGRGENFRRTFLVIGEKRKNYRLFWEGSACGMELGEGGGGREEGVSLLTLIEGETLSQTSRSGLGW